jgi:glycosyltransferase involved in cell wall biosynthesis
MSAHRILVIAHGHPEFSPGGGEMAAYNLFKGYRAHALVEAAWFLGRIDRKLPPSGAISTLRPGEYLWEQAAGHNFASLTDTYFRQFEDLLRALKPTVVHVHHYMHTGIGVLRALKRIDPSIRLVLTLHEFLAICQNKGQMVKNGSLRLCYESSLEACRECFPDRSREDFWLRKQYMLGHFANVDQFVAPSAFLRQRYVDWGVPAERIVVIENGHADATPLEPRALRAEGTRNRFAFFGQVNEFKGIDVLLQAFAGMSRRERRRLVLEIHAANLEHQEDKFREKIERLRAPLMEEGLLRWAGPYGPAELGQRMARIDWVLVPSIWWENSPMVIQEAFVYGRPVICSGIGGMAEKVRDGVDGLHADAGNPVDWADTLLRAAETPGLWEKLRAGIRAPLTHAACAQAHLALL